MEDSLYDWDVEVGHLEELPLFMGAEPESLLYCDWADVARNDGKTSVVRGDGVGLGGVNDGASVVHSLELRPLHCPKEVTIGLGEAAIEVKPPCEELAFVRIVERAWVTWLAGVILNRRKRRNSHIKSHDGADVASAVVEDLAPLSRCRKGKGIDAILLER